MTSEQVYTASELARRRLPHVHARMDAGVRLVVVRRHDGQEDRRWPGEQPDQPETLRFNAWASDASGWAGALDEAALPAYQFVNWIKYYRYDSGQFVLDWTDEFDAFDTTRWAKGNWTFDGNLGRLRSRERGGSGRDADSRHHERRRDRVQRDGSHRTTAAPTRTAA